MKVFKLVWSDNLVMKGYPKSQFIKGETIDTAFANAGFSKSANLPSDWDDLEYWKEVEVDKFLLELTALYINACLKSNKEMVFTESEIKNLKVFVETIQE